MIPCDHVVGTFTNSRGSWEFSCASEKRPGLWKRFKHCPQCGERLDHKTDVCFLRDIAAVCEYHGTYETWAKPLREIAARLEGKT